MIREFQTDDINKVADIWLDTNIKAHNFIPSQYWKNDEYVEGIFVSGEMQSQGIGKILLNYAKDKRNKLLLNVYQKNARALSELELMSLCQNYRMAGICSSCNILIKTI